MEIGEFHWKDGIYFKREEDGSVRLRIQHGAPLGVPQIAPIVATIPPNEWASIVSHVSKSGESTGFQTALDFHNA